MRHAAVYHDVADVLDNVVLLFWVILAAMRGAP
jgi:hypothetical protein